MAKGLLAQAARSRTTNRSGQAIQEVIQKVIEDAAGYS
jgi:hypothetical protein